jgi:hypothetical protein
MNPNYLKQFSIQSFISGMTEPFYLGSPEMPFLHISMHSYLLEILLAVLTCLFKEALNLNQHVLNLINVLPFRSENLVL